MTLWMLTPLPAGRVAIRIRNVDDRPRRVTIGDAGSEALEEWRCSRCLGWFPRETIQLVRSGRVVAGTPEIAAHCGACADSPALPRGWP